jgi:5'-deoxynucleotidase YfbR-like HD superfamily hydrolase
MARLTHGEIEALVRQLVLPLYHVQRDTLLPLSGQRWENDAEHAWSVAFLACALAPHIDPALDVGLVAQYAIVHDSIEIFADDTSPFDATEKQATKTARETAALDHIVTTYSHFSWVTQTMQAYEHKGTNEARYVSAIDKYITVLYDYIDEGRQLRQYKLTQAEYDRRLEVQRQKVLAHHPGVAVYYEEVRTLLAARPEFFHPVGNLL